MKTWMRHRFAILLLFAVLLLAAVGAVWRFGYVQALTQLAQRGEADLTLAADRLTAQLQRYQELAVLMASHPALAHLSTTGEGEEVARAVLVAAADRTSALNLRYLDRNGRVLASAFGPATPTLAGAPSFERAMQGALGAYHDVDPETGLRAFHFAAPDFGKDGRVRGVLMVSVDVAVVEDNWRGDGPPVLFIDDSGLVFITNRSELLLWKRENDGFGIVPPTSAAPPFRSFQDAGHEMWLMQWGPYVPKRGMHLVRPLPVIGMTSEAIIDVSPARRLASLQAAVVAALFFAFGAFLYQAMQRRRVLSDANAILEERVAMRTRALSETNIQLRQEITERQEAEAALTKVQADLVQAGKLSALGQMSAGISHELNQPLMAIQQFAENGTLFLKRGKGPSAADNLKRISEMAARMARIIKNLRSFARNESEPMGKVDLVQVLNTAVELTSSRLGRDEIAMDWTPARYGGPIYAWGGEVRLVQVFVNLINNAGDAMMEQNDRQIRISIETGTRLAVKVCDIGPGIEDPDKMFEPFYSTKAIGSSEGMGLGLSISYGLVESFGGSIRGSNATRGAMFTVELDHWNEEQVA